MFEALMDGSLIETFVHVGPVAFVAYTAIWIALLSLPILAVKKLNLRF